MVERETHTGAELVDRHRDPGHVYRHRVRLVRVVADADHRTPVAAKRVRIECQQARLADLGVRRLQGGPVQRRLDAVKSCQLLALESGEPFAAIAPRL